MKCSKILSFVVAGLLFMLTALNAQNEAKKPNILLFVGDDMTWADCSPYGNEDVHTPNIEKLAHQGTSFDNMFTGTAMCAPTRQQLYSGMYPVRSGAYPNHSIMYDGAKSFATYFVEMGYRNGLIGKKHYGPDSSFPLTYFGGVQHDNGKGQDIDLSKIEDFIVDDNEKPYFMVISQNQPHMPWTRGNREQYDAEELTVPEFLIDCDFTRAEMVKYYAEITYMDSILGVCMDYVDRSGEADNTIVIFTSEQGSQFPFAKWTCYDTGLKTSFIMRWPEKIEAGKRVDNLLHYVDVLPTLIELVGRDPRNIHTGIPDVCGNTGFDGQSFASVFEGGDHPREYVYGAQTTRGIYHGPEAYAIRSIRNKKYKLIWNLHHETEFTNLVTEKKNNNILDIWLREASDASDSARTKMYTNRPEFELYDIRKDPSELNNLAGGEEYKTVKKRMFNELKKWMASQGDLGHETEMRALERQDK